MRHFLFSIHKSDIYSIRKGIRPTLIYEDNASAIAISKNPVCHGKSKHIKIRYHGIRDRIEEGEIAVEYKPTDKMAADGLTKALSVNGVKKMRSNLRLEEEPGR